MHEMSETENENGCVSLTLVNIFFVCKFKTIYVAVLEKHCFTSTERLITAKAKVSVSLGKVM